MKKLLALSALVVILGCSNPADNVPAASVGPASTPAESSDSAADATETVAGDAAASSSASDSAQPAPAAATPGDVAGSVYTFGPENAKIEFTGSKVTGSHDGGFKEFSGELRLENGELADRGIQVEIITDSLWSDSDRLTGHLKNQDFFHVEKYPTATFVSTAIDPSDNGATITGDLTLHGVTKSISFPAQVEVAEGKVHLASEFSINRFDFDIKYAGKADDLIRQEVVIRLDVTATPGSAE
jgi:polyisoprenoid-binding protein YceI